MGTAFPVLQWKPGEEQRTKTTASKSPSFRETGAHGCFRYHWKWQWGNPMKEVQVLAD